MFVLSIKELMLQRGIKPNVNQLVRRGIGKTAAKNLLNGKAKSITLEQLFLLCQNFNCTPKEVMYAKLQNPAGFENHPLKAWSQEPKAYPLEDFILLTPEQLEKTQEFINSILEEGETKK